MKSASLVALLGLLSGAGDVLAEEKLSLGTRSLASEWTIEKAVSEAVEDVLKGTPKIYLAGTFASYAPGVPTEAGELVSDLPRSLLSSGCIVEPEVAEAQHEFARTYNQFVVRHYLMPRATREARAHSR